MRPVAFNPRDGLKKGEKHAHHLYSIHPEPAGKPFSLRPTGPVCYVAGGMLNRKRPLCWSPVPTRHHDLRLYPACPRDKSASFSHPRRLAPGLPIDSSTPADRRGSIRPGTKPSRVANDVVMFYLGGLVGLVLFLCLRGLLFPGG